MLEAVVRGHVAAVDATGRLVAAAGDPEAILPARSTVKPVQARPYVEEAHDRIGAGDRHLAVACASHEGEPEHVATVRELLDLAGVPEEALACGAQEPYSAAAARELVRAGRAPLPVHNNCSGKHAAMLATCRVLGLPLDGYREPSHPLQQRVTTGLVEAAGAPLLEFGVDGCGLPTYGLPLWRLARMFAASAAAGGSFARCQAAMAAHPLLVGGTGRFDSALLGAAGGRLTAKSGGAACWAATARDGSLAVAVKLEAGAGAYLPPVALATLRALDMADGATAEALAAFARPPLTNWEGRVVGETRAVVELRRC